MQRISIPDEMMKEIHAFVEEHSGAKRLWKQVVLKFGLPYHPSVLSSKYYRWKSGPRCPLPKQPVLADPNNLVHSTGQVVDYRR